MSKDDAIARAVAFEEARRKEAERIAALPDYSQYPGDLNLLGPEREAEYQRAGRGMTDIVVELLLDPLAQPKQCNKTRLVENGSKIEAGIEYIVERIPAHHSFENDQVKTLVVWPGNKLVGVKRVNNRRGTGLTAFYKKLRPAR